MEKKKIAKSIRNFLLLSFSNFIFLIIIAYIKWFYRVDFIPIYLFLALISGWLARISLVKATVRWFFSNIPGIIIIFLLAKIFGGRSEVEFIIHDLVPVVVLYVASSSFAFIISRGLRYQAKIIWAKIGLITLIFITFAVSWFYIHRSCFSREVREYLKSNSTSINISHEEFLTSFSILEPYLNTHDIFFTGEHHGTKKNYDLRFYLIKYFNKKANIRYHLTETSYSGAFLVNRYLETREEKYIKKYIKTLKGTFGYNNEVFEFWKEVRKYNLTIPKDDRIIFIGIDVEHQSDAAILALNYLLPEKLKEGQPPYINKIREICKKIEKNDFCRGNYRDDLLDDIKTLINNLKEELKNNDVEYRNYLKKNMFDFEFIIDNCINAYSFYEKREKGIREKAIFNNFVKIYKSLPESVPRKFYGQWGGYHVYQNCSEKDKRFADMLQHKNESLVKGKVLSIYLVYNNSYNIRDRKTGESEPTYNHPQPYNGLLRWYGLELSKLATGDMIIFKLTGKNSPFQKSKIFVENYTKNNNCCTTDCFQFLILIKNSKANTIYKE